MIHKLVSRVNRRFALQRMFLWDTLGIMTNTFVRLKHLIATIGLNQGQVIALAREISQNGALVSIAQLRRAELEEMEAFLNHAGNQCQ